ncbi:hypothetical protein KA005_05780 [bacterium]|nr:hypothetical protein [bacterium]
MNCIHGIRLDKDCIFCINGTEPKKYIPPNPNIEYAYKDIKEYEKITNVKVNEAFKIGWQMARTTIKDLHNL